MDLSNSAGNLEKRECEELVVNSIQCNREVIQNEEQSQGMSVLFLNKAIK